MLIIEFKKSFHNKTFLYLMALTGVAFVMGWILPVGIDKIDNLSYSDYLFSLYTVFTQFGLLFFCFVTSYYINRDYAQKNTLFYCSFGSNALEFYFRKILVLIVEESLSILCWLGVISIIYHDFSMFGITFVLFNVIVLQYFMISGVFSFLFNNLLVSIGLSIFFWITTIVMVSIGGVLKYAAVFDASNDMYWEIEKILSGTSAMLSMKSLQGIFIEITLLIIVNMMAVILSGKRWIKLGI